MRSGIARLVLAGATALCLASNGQAAEVAGVRVEDAIRLGSQELQLNGAGVRTRFFVKVYVGALYVAQKTSAAATVLDAKGPRRMTLRLLRDIDADTLLGALTDGLRDNHTESELAALKESSDRFGEIMRKVGNGKNGDQIALDIDERGVAVALNGEPRGLVASPSFGRALLKVWLGERPVDGSLKKALLGADQ